MRVSGSVDDHDDDDDDDDEREGWMRVSGSVKAQTRVDDLCHNCVAHTNTHHHVAHTNTHHYVALTNTHHYVHTQIHTIM